jgi:glycosyltransferase involved in cell wall biosynthesis
MPRVLRIINRFNLGGPTYNAAYLTKYMSDDYETLLIGGAHSESEEDSLHITQQLGIEPIIIPEMRRDISPKEDHIAYKKIHQLIDWFKPDIVHTHASKAGALGRLAAIRSKTPIIVHTFHGHVFHSYFSKIKTQAYISIERRLAANTDAIIAISPLQKKELVDEFAIASEEKVKVIPLGFDLSRFKEKQNEKRSHFRQEYHLEDEVIAIGIIGRLVPIKNHHLFLDLAAKTLNMSDRPVKFFIIGDGELKDELQARAIELKLNTADGSSAKIIFTSWIKNIDEAIAGLDIIVMTSNNEGTPVSLIEAQAGERAIVSTDVGGIRDIIIPDKTALISQKNDLDALSKNLVELIDNRLKRIEMGELGYHFVKEKFTYDRLAKDMDKLYSELLKQKNGIKR